MKIELEAPQIVELQYHMVRHEELLREMMDNMEVISRTIIQINAKENQPEAGTND